MQQLSELCFEKIFRLKNSGNMMSTPPWHPIVGCRENLVRGWAQGNQVFPVSLPDLPTGAGLAG